jgi:RNA polymerase sigma-70 factor, ECF subfamily
MSEDGGRGERTRTDQSPKVPANRDRPKPVPRTPAEGPGTLRRQLEELYDTCGAQLFTCALAVTRCRDLAEDAVHDAFCRLFRLESPPRDLRAYAFRSVRNAAVDLVRARNRSVALPEDSLFDFSDNARETAQKKEFEQRAAEALDTLGPDERETIVHHFYAGLTFREIAEMRDAPLGTVTSWYHRGIAKMKEKMKVEG